MAEPVVMDIIREIFKYGPQERKLVPALYDWIVANGETAGTTPSVAMVSSYGTMYRGDANSR